MNKKSIFIILAFFLLTTAVPASHGRPKVFAECPQPSLVANGYVLLHPYFNEKSWKIALGNISLCLPDTFISGQGVQPISFDIGKGLDSTASVFTTAQGDLFLMHSYFTPNIGGCQAGEIAFSAPQKIPLSGISITAKTPIYLIKDSLFFKDSIRIVAGTSSPPLCALIVKMSTASIVKIDTLQMQNPGAVTRIEGDYSLSAQRDTSIWVVGSSGMIRSFSIGRNTLGQERIWDISGSSDTVKCIGGIYAGTNTGRIYRKNTSQTFVSENAGSGSAINAIYQQGAICAQGNFIEHVDSSWISFTLGSSNYQYANFIRRPGGFGVELLDSKWKYEAYTYRDTASKILRTIPSDKRAYVNNGTWHVMELDTGVSIHILDPDSNYKDFKMSLKHGKTLDTIGLNIFTPIPDSETCHVGRIRLTDGIINIKFQKDSIAIRANSEIGTQRIDCGTCYWKKYDFSINKQWNLLDSVIIKAGKDTLKIQKNFGPVTTVFSVSDIRINAKKVWCRVWRDHLMLHASVPNLKCLSVFDISGRRICSLPASDQLIISIPHSFSSGIVFLDLVFKDGSHRKMVLPVLP